MVVWTENCFDKDVGLPVAMGCRRVDEFDKLKSGLRVDTCSSRLGPCIAPSWSLPTLAQRQQYLSANHFAPGLENSS
jgi:hypothetical protein